MCASSKHMVEFVLLILGKNNKSGANVPRIIGVVVSSILVVGLLIGAGWYLLVYRQDNTGRSKRDRDRDREVEETTIAMAVIPFDPDDIIDNNDYDYREAKDELEEAGFTNIEVEAVDDLTTGLINHPDTIESISVGGRRNFDEGDEFEADVHIVIRYHTR